MRKIKYSWSVLSRPLLYVIINDKCSCSSNYRHLPYVTLTSFNIIHIFFHRSQWWRTSTWAWIWWEWGWHRSHQRQSRGHHTWSRGESEKSWQHPEFSNNLHHKHELQNDQWTSSSKEKKVKWRGIWDSYHKRNS